MGLSRSNVCLHHIHLETCSKRVQNTTWAYLLFCQAKIHTAATGPDQLYESLRLSSRHVLSPSKFTYKAELNLFCPTDLTSCLTLCTSLSILVFGLLRPERGGDRSIACTVHLLDYVWRKDVVGLFVAKCFCSLYSFLHVSVFVLLLEHAR